MTFTEAAATQPLWLQLWFAILVPGIYVPPFVLLFWRTTRKIGLIAIAANIAVAIAVVSLFNALGYVKLLGLPHVVFWTPVLLLIIVSLRARSFPTIPQRAMQIMAVILIITLVVDTIDVVRYIMGERQDFAVQAIQQSR